MANNRPTSSDLIPQLARTALAVGRLADSDELFRAALDAFRALDGESFQRLLAQHDLSVHCELVCRWFRVKESVLRCIELCGPPPESPFTAEDIRGFAEAVVRVTGDEELVERLAEAIRGNDRDVFGSLVRDLGIERFCHLLCYWASTVYSRLICEVVCSPEPVHRRSLESELARAGAAIGALLTKQGALDEVIKASLAADCETVSGLVGPGGGCFWICEWICSWRCVRICLLLCREFPPPADTSIDEMRTFAQLTARIAGTEGALARLVDSIAAGDSEAFAATVRELSAEPFCIQLCHWICFEFCRLFCECVCPPPEVIPMFTKVGSYRVDPIWNDFTADGTTTVGGLAFTSDIPLVGIIPNGDTATPIAYRFLTEKYPLGGGSVSVTAATIAPTIIGQLEYFEWDTVALAWVPRSANYWVNQPDPGLNTISITQQVGPPLSVSVNKNVAPDGWIDVPRDNALFFGGTGLFVGGANNTLALLLTTTLTNEVFDLTLALPPLPVLAGDPVPAAQQSERPHYKIYFEARNAVTLAGVSANNLDKIALSNTTYTYTRHPDWAGGAVSTTPVVSIDAQELKAGGGCRPVSGHIHALFTAYHPYLGTCSVFIQGPGIPPPAAVTPAISAAGQATSPAGGQDFNISTLTPCAYVLWISTTLNLTQGFGKISGEFDDLIAFCIR